MKIKTTLKEGEHILLGVRKHAITLFAPLLIIGLIFFLIFAAPKAIGEMVKSIAPYAIGLSFAYFGYAFYDRKTNIFVVTNYRVIREWGIFSYNVMENSLDKIHNVGVRQDILGMILGYGDLIIQTAAEVNNKAERFIASPKKFQAAIFKAQEDIRTMGNTYNRQPHMEQNGDTIECPYCVERIKAKAKVCRFCNREVGNVGVQQAMDRGITVKTESQHIQDESKLVQRRHNNDAKDPRAFLRGRL